MTGKTVFLTGASGYIGSRLARTLTDHGHRVIAHFNQTPENRCNAISAMMAYATEDFIVGSLWRPKYCLGRITVDIDVVVHAAALLSGTPSDLYSTNAALTEEIAKHSGAERIPRFIYLSTAQMYAPQHPMHRSACDEESPIAPRKHIAYFASKLAGEWAVREAYPDATVLRLGSVYGRGGRGVIDQFARTARQGLAPHVFENAHLNPVHLDDVATVVERFVRTGLGGTFNVVAGQYLSIREIAELIATHYGVEPEKPHRLLPPENDFPPVANHRLLQALNSPRLLQAFPELVLRGLAPGDWD